jgi:membrane protease YdiL (CAAX protease family)
MSQSKKHDKKIYPDTDKDKSVILWVGVGLMMVSTIIIHLYSAYVLDSTIDYITSSFWVFSIFPLFIYMLYFQHKKKILFADIGLKKKGIIKASFVGIISGAAIGVIGWAITQLIGLSVYPAPDNLIKLFIIRSVVFAPIYEEILVRGLLWSALSYTLIFIFKGEHKPGFEKKKDIAIIVIISLVFLFFHYDRDTTLFLTKFVFDSFAFSILYYKTKNLMTPIMAHSIANLFVLLQSFIF